MLYYIQIWRQIRGYSSNGQRSHSNNKNNKKNKIILMFRVQQFYKLFGKKRRDIFPTLILAEYTNRLWFIVWHVHWLEGKLFFFRLQLFFKIKKVIKAGKKQWGKESIDADRNSSGMPQQEAF